MPDNEKPVGRAYEGPSGIGRDSIWLTAEDLVEGRDMKLTISRVILYPRVKFQGGRVRENMIGLEFVGKQRVLGLNATNRKALNAMFGNITAAWKGQKITLFVSEAQLAGELVKCVRIRNKGSRVATAAEEFLHEEPGDMRPAAEASPGKRFDDLCQELGVQASERQRLILKHNGNFETALAELESVGQGG